MRAGRSIIVECARALRYRRAFVTLRAVVLLAVGMALCLGASLQMLLGAYDALQFCTLFVGMLWGAFIVGVATWRLV